MKILRIIRSMNPAQGGVVEAVNQAALSFNNEKWQMDVLCLDDPDASWVVSNSSYTVHAVGVGRTAYGFHFSYLNWLRKNAKDYDVVIIDGLWQFLVVGGYVLKLLKVPYCIFTHGMLDPYFNEDKLKYVKKLPFWFLVERNVIAMASATIFTCQEEAQLAEMSFPCYKASPKVATLGVEGNNHSGKKLSELFLAEHLQLKNKQFALFLSRINEKKGIDLLVGALGKIKNIPDDFMFAIAGPDSNGLKAKLMVQIEDQGLSDRVVWLGMLSGDVKWGAYHAADVFILPSHQENFGIVVAEALSTATPVLITNKVNIWREIDKACSGFVENDDVEGIESLLNCWLALSITEKTEMSVCAKACYEANFSIESAVDDLARVLNHTAKSKRSYL
jgi:glycosyltransferase involved in cell wall biosynthesis